MKYDLTGMARLGEGMMRAGPLMHVPSMLEGFGLKPAPLQRAAGLSRDALSLAENVIPLSAAVRLMIIAAARTERPHFALLVGEAARLTQYGLIGLRMMHAPSVGTAWRGVMLTLHLNDRANVPALAVHDRLATLSFTPYIEEQEGNEHIMDFTLATACSAMRTICGPQWAPTETQFAHRAPADIRPYQRLFKSPVRFDASQTAMLFPATWLDRPVVGADPVVRRKIELAVADILRQQKLGLLAKVRRALFAQIIQGDVSVEGVALLLGLHKRTLNRRLADKGTSFAKLLGEVRFQLARQLLAETALPLSDIAAALNYADGSAFSRAFRSWSRKSPSTWRHGQARARFGR